MQPTCTAASSSRRSHSVSLAISVSTSIQTMRLDLLAFQIASAFPVLPISTIGRCYAGAFGLTGERAVTIQKLVPCHSSLSTFEIPKGYRSLRGVHYSLLAIARSPYPGQSVESTMQQGHRIDTTVKDRLRLALVSSYPDPDFPRGRSCLISPGVRSA